MTDRLASIPDDLPICQEHLRCALVRIHDVELQLDETVATAEELERKLTCLTEEYRTLQRMIFGPRRERLPEDPGQLHLFDGGVPPSVPELAPDDPAPSSRKRRKGHGRRPIPDHLPRREFVHDILAKDQVCACGRDKVRIGQDQTEQVELVPAKLLVLRHVYPKYVCSHCKDGVTSAEPAATPIERGLAGPGLLAHVLVSKYAEHMPLYRQQDELARHGIYFARSTLCGWMAQCADLFRPLVQRMRQRVLQSAVIQADETPVPVLDPNLTSTRTGYFFAFVGDKDHPDTVYDYRDSRGREGPAEFLGKFQGFLQTDAYSAYESVVKASDGRIIPVGCWAHARRDFFDARTNQPREVHYVLGLIAQLYDIEDETRLFAPEQRLEVRQQRSVPVLDRLRVFLREQKDGALPRSKYGQAIGYVLNHWDELHRFTEDGRLEIDNNTTERTVRPCAIGRKNWMFVGSDRGGETAAICYSILASAKRHRVEPFAYVQDLLLALSSRDVNLDSLLADVWLAAHPEHFQQHRRDESEAAAKARRRRRARRREAAAAGPSP